MILLDTQKEKKRQIPYHVGFLVFPVTLMAKQFLGCEIACCFPGSFHSTLVFFVSAGLTVRPIDFVETGVVREEDRQERKTRDGETDIYKYIYISIYPYTYSQTGSNYNIEIAKPSTT